MSDPPKSVPTFSFGTPAASASGSSSNSFGQKSSITQKPAGSGLFGSSSNPPSTSSPSLVGNNTFAGPTDSAFGANIQKITSLGATQQTGGGGGIFGGGGESGSSELDFGSGPTSNALNAGSSSGFAGFSTPNKPAETSSAGQGSNLFGTAGNTTGGGLFGNAGSGASSGQTNTTPASKPSTGFSFGSTTPAGPPPIPSSNAATGGAAASLFSNNKPQEANASSTNNLFANLGAPKSTAQPSGGAAAPSNPFGGFSQPSGAPFGSSKISEPNAATSSAQPSGGLFGAAQNKSTSNLFGNKAPQSGGGMFGNLNNPQESGDNNSQGSAAKPNLFPNLGGQSLGVQSPSSTDNARKPAFSFPPPKSQPVAEDADPKPTQASSGLGLFGRPTSSGASNIATTAASAGGSFSSLGGTSAAPSTAPGSGLFPLSGASTAPSNTSTSTTTAPSTSSAPGPSSTLFGSLATSAIPATTSQPTAQAPTVAGPSRTGPSNTDLGASAGGPLGKGSSNANLGASTSGPPPTAQSRLKNKSMDEIITRWASDLSKYQKEFQKQAERVAAWDRMLVENSEKIQKLYGSTLEAERATTEVERQLTAVENDQNELEIWLDYYEKEVDSLTSKQIGQGESLQGPDSDRERT